MPIKSRTTVEPRFNEPQFNEVLDITNEILRPSQSYSKMYGIKPRYNEPRYNEFFDLTNIIRKPKRKIYLDIANYNVNHAAEDKRWTAQQSTHPLILMVKRLQPFSQWLITCRRHGHYSISTEVTCVTNQALTLTSI